MGTVKSQSKTLILRVFWGITDTITFLTFFSRLSNFECGVQCQTF
jgi:hypothetical protein